MGVVLLRLHLPPVYVDQIGQRLECKKRNPNGQTDPDQGNLRPCQAVAGIDQHIGIFKNAENQKIGTHGQRQNRLFLPCPPDPQAVEIIQACAARHQKDVDRLAVCIKQ